MFLISFYKKKYFRVSYRFSALCKHLYFEHLKTRLCVLWFRLYLYSDARLYQFESYQAIIARIRYVNFDSFMEKKRIHDTCSTMSSFKLVNLLEWDLIWERFSFVTLVHWHNQGMWKNISWNDIFVKNFEGRCQWCKKCFCVQILVTEIDVNITISYK